MKLNILGTNIGKKHAGGGIGHSSTHVFFSNVAPRISIIPGGDNKKEHKALVLPYTIYRTALGGFKL